MPYSEEDFARMETDPVLRRQYFWTVAQKALARERALRKQGQWAESAHDGRFGRIIMENIDRLVETTGG